MSYEDLLSQIYAELPHLQGQLKAPRVVYVRAQGKVYITFESNVLVEEASFLRMERILRGYARAGLVVTDGLFMCSRNGYDFLRYDEAFLRPPVEHPYSWMYGDCYTAAGLVETPSDIPGADNEYSIYVMENYRAATGYALIVRYSLRLDGFVSRHAGEREECLVTKPFTYEGSALYANLETSAKGYAYFTLTCEGEEYTSYECFGNSADKRIHFPDDAGVTLTVRLMDADLYAIRFGT